MSDLLKVTQQVKKHPNQVTGLRKGCVVAVMVNSDTSKTVAMPTELSGRHIPGPEEQESW